MRLTNYRRFVWFGFLSTFAVTTLICFGLYFHGSPINEANARRIKPGMRLADVEAILGPERNESGRLLNAYMWPEYRWGRVWKEGRLCIIDHRCHWVTEAIDIAVYFDEKYRVTLVEYQPPVFADNPSTFRDRIRNYARRAWAVLWSKEWGPFQPAAATW